MKLKVSKGIFFSTGFKHIENSNNRCFHPNLHCAESLKKKIDVPSKIIRKKGKVTF